MEEFLASDKAKVHVMRDHPAHVAFMMGGMWGAKVSKLRKEFLQAYKKMFQVRIGGLVSQDIYKQIVQVLMKTIPCYIWFKITQSYAERDYFTKISPLGFIFWVS